MDKVARPSLAGVQMASFSEVRIHWCNTDMHLFARLSASGLASSTTAGSPIWIPFSTRVGHSVGGALDRSEKWGLLQ